MYELKLLALKNTVYDIPGIIGAPISTTRNNYLTVCIPVSN